MFVVNSKSGEILMCNESASEKIKHYESYIKDVISLTREKGSDVEVAYRSYDNILYLQVNRFSLDWFNEKAEIYVIDDVTEARNELADLEAHAFTDTMTNLNNRTYGMTTLNIWIKEKKKFALIFVDLDSLKYLNDSFGHAEGDMFITRTADELAKFSDDTVACRIGGDEFMILAPEVGFDAANKRMTEISEILRTYKHEYDKEFSYSISYGIAVVDEDSKLEASDILHVADLRMYDHKQYNKRIKKLSARSKSAD
jgi:diguanylate cyclase (GGDEF)-like protein